MGVRDVVLDIIARDNASRRINDVGDAMDRTGGRADSSSDRLKQFAARVSDVSKRLGSVGATLASSASLIGPVATGFLAAGKSIAVVGQGIASLAPLAAFLPGLVGAAQLIKGTFILMGPALAQAFAPVANAFKAAGVEVGALATKGLPQLARGFVAVNMPSITSAMDRIAVSTNKVVLGVGKWINSAQGQHLVKTIADATAAAFERLGPKVEKSAIALLKLADRAGDKAITGLGDIIGKIVDKFTQWADNTSVADINKALSDLSGWGQKLKATFDVLRDVGQWMADNEGKVRAFSDALAVAGIALGAITGNWAAVAIGAFTLLVNHWESVKTAFSGAGAWWSGIWNTIKNDPNVQAIWQTIKDIAFTVKNDFKAAWDSLQPTFQKFGAAAQQAWAQIGPMVTQFIKDPNVVAGIRTIAISLGAMALAWLTVQGATVLAIGAITAVIIGFNAWFVGTVVTNVMNGIASIIGGFGSWLVAMGRMTSAIPGMGSVGQAMMNAGNDALGAAGKVQQLANSIGQLQSKTIQIRTEFIQTTTVSYSSAKPVIGKATGGLIPGAPSKVDTVPAVLARGEFVVNSAATAKNLPLLKAINDGAGAGPGTASSSSAASGGDTYVYNVSVTAGAVGSEDFLARAVTGALEKTVRRGRGSLVLARG